MAWGKGSGIHGRAWLGGALTWVRARFALGVECVGGGGRYCRQQVPYSLALEAKMPSFNKNKKKRSEKIAEYGVWYESHKAGMATEAKLN